MHENWPDPVEGNYNGDYWADPAFTARYWRDFIEVSRQVAEHVNAKGWDDTFFQCFLNNKSQYKAGDGRAPRRPGCWMSPPASRTSGPSAT